MLSYLYRLAADYERTHGCRPNLVYLNRLHYRMLRENLGGMDDEQQIARFLGMNVFICPDITHPDVAWIGPERRHAVGE